jgi:Exonuclease VII, large subunit.
MIYEKNLANSLLMRLKRERERISRLSSSRCIARPYERVDPLRQQLDGKLRELTLITKTRLEKQRSRLAGLAGRLDALSPLTVLSRGYAIAQKEDGSVIKSVKNMTAGERISVRVADGRFAAVFDRVLDSFPDKVEQ